MGHLSALSFFAKCMRLQVGQNQAKRLPFGRKTQPNGFCMCLSILRALGMFRVLYWVFTHHSGLVSGL